MHMTKTDGLLLSNSTQMKMTCWIIVLGHLTATQCAAAAASATHGEPERLHKVLQYNFKRKPPLRFTSTTDF